MTKQVLGITDCISGSGSAECEVYATEHKNIVFKQFFCYCSHKVQGIIDANRTFAAQGLAPQVCSDVIKVGSQYGYFTERVTPVEDLNHLSQDTKDAIADKLADELGLEQGFGRNEIYHNWGFTKDSRAVLLDFGTLTLHLLQLDGL